ncbi:hypothetical protein BJY26_001678 [Spelaeicoccus albus]|uniref:Uncharacterized protein n=1 Tax=Spelaeicoccus albus TaxID=1280376 RepID=A0A7Z0AAE3_9MICO|nr:hypothetical protein [Spelaeicoccus albus]
MSAPIVFGLLTAVAGFAAMIVLLIVVVRLFFRR